MTRISPSHSAWSIGSAGNNTDLAEAGRHPDKSPSGPLRGVEPRSLRSARGRSRLGEGLSPPD